ncbi:MAG: chemotaxis protein MotB [Sphingobacteriales bacterium]
MLPLYIDFKLITNNKMGKLVQRLGFILVLATMVSGCVPARKYQELKENEKNLGAENRGLKERLATVEGQGKDLQVAVNQLRKINTRLADDTAAMTDRMRRVEQKFEKLNQLNDELLRKYADLQRGSQNANEQLSEELELMQSKLQLKEDELTLVGEELDRKRKNLGKISGELESRETRVKELEAMLQQKDEKVNALKTRISKALLGFKDKGLLVEEKGGKVYVSMEAKLLFASGSTKVNAEGSVAIKELAKALSGQEDLEILVEGHTDTDKFLNPTFPKDNWDLSVLRSTSVVRILQAEGVDPEAIIAGGRSEYLPLDAADKAKNRRIEVIISPNLDALFELIKEKESGEEEGEEN